MLVSSISLLLVIGLANSEPQDIIGGEVLPKGKRPYLASLVYGDNQGCGASLVHPLH